MSKDDENESRLPSDPVAKRLEKLRDRPLEMERLRERVRSAVAASRPTARMLRWFTSVRTIAAILLITGAVVAVLWMTSGGPLPASAEELSSIHRENASGESHATPVDSVQSAHQVLAAQWSDCPHLPQVPASALASCHVQRFSGKRLACLALRVEGQAMTLVVAHAADMRVPTTGQRVARGGVNYCVQSSGGVNIVIAQRDGLWLCLMSELPAEKIIDFAASF